MNNYKVQPFLHYVLRTPLFPISFYLKLIENYSEEKLFEILENPIVLESIRIASPELIAIIDKWKNQPLSSNKKHKNLELTVLKYISRMSARCTPFGLFAGCTVGEIGLETEIILKDPKDFSRFTQFDMQFLVSSMQKISKQEPVKTNLKYYPNNSIYLLGDFYRYIEYKYVKTKREHSITALRSSAILETLLSNTKYGKTINEMTAIIIDDESEKEEALKFINQLINFQFLVSELDASLTGNDYWEVLNQISKDKKEIQFLNRIKSQLKIVDKTLVPSEEKYQDIKKLLDSMHLEYDEKYLFQTDLNTAAKTNTVNKEVVKKTTQALNFLNGIQEDTKYRNQENFIKAFIKRYEYQEMPLTTVLDTETGIGYIQNSELNDVHAILERFSFKNSDLKTEKQEWTEYDFILEKKMQECISKNDKMITLSEKDFPNFNSNWNNAPATFSVMIELLENDEVVIESTGNSSAAKLLGRFCIGNTAIKDLTNKIIEKETNYYPDKILAEIVHIPESRTGNILRRPVLRPYEIAYLAKSGVKQENSIGLNDLMISIQNNKIVLRSKQHNKEIIPCLSNAHNYANNSLPVYHFLCDLQSQNLKPVYNFDWGALHSHYNFFPRINYKNTILSKAKWIVYKEELKQFEDFDKSEMYENFSNWKRKRNLPRFVNWVHGDNTLLLDLEKEISISLFLKSVQNYSKITLEEFLFSKDSVVKNAQSESFTNQIILSFYTQKPKK